MTREQRVNPLVEAAVLASLTVIMGALAIYFLPLKFVFDFAWGIPAIIIIKRHDLKLGIMMLFIAGFLTFLFAGPLLTALLYVELAPLALTYGFLFKKEISPGRTLLIGTFVSGLATVALLLMLISIDAGSIFPTEEQLRQQAEIVVNLYSSMGLMKVEDVDYFARVSVNLARIFIPTFFIFSGFLRAVITYLLAVRVLRKLEYPVSPLPPFSQWKLPWYFVWLLIAGLGFTLIGDQYKLNNLALIGKIIFFSVLPLFLVIGLAVVTGFFKSWKIPLWVKVLMGIAAALNWIVSLIILTLIGIFDPLFSFRNRKKPKE